MSHTDKCVCMCVFGPHVDVLLCVLCLVCVCQNVCADTKCDCMSVCVWSVEASGRLADLR